MDGWMDGWGFGQSVGSARLPLTQLASHLITSYQLPTVAVSPTPYLYYVTPPPDPSLVGGFNPHGHGMETRAHERTRASALLKKATHAHVGFHL
jgi:hypothetical protein